MDSRKCQTCDAMLSDHDEQMLCPSCLEKSKARNDDSASQALVPLSKCVQCQSILKSNEAGPMCGKCQHAAGLPPARLCARCQKTLLDNENKHCAVCSNAIAQRSFPVIVLKLGKGLVVLLLSVISLITGLVGTCTLVAASGSSTSSLPFAWVMLGISALCIWLGMRTIRSMNDVPKFLLTKNDSEPSGGEK